MPLGGLHGSRRRLQHLQQKGLQQLFSKEGVTQAKNSLFRVLSRGLAEYAIDEVPFFRGPHKYATAGRALLIYRSRCARGHS
jgi:hypothetical protein